MKRIIILMTAAVLLNASGQAQEIAAPSAKAQQKSALFQESLVLLEKGDTKAAEQLLLSGTRAKANTLEWRMENAQSLIRGAFFFRQKGSIALSQSLGLSALEQLTQAAKLVTTSSDEITVSRIYEMAGLISERIVGDSNQAYQFYKAGAESASVDTPAKQKYLALQQAQLEAAKRQLIKPKG